MESGGKLESEAVLLYGWWLDVEGELSCNSQKLYINEQVLYLLWQYKDLMLFAQANDETLHHIHIHTYI